MFVVTESEGFSLTAILLARLDTSVKVLVSATGHHLSELIVCVNEEKCLCVSVFFLCCLLCTFLSASALLDSVVPQIGLS